jgi:hypothetical protein
LAYFFECAVDAPMLIIDTLLISLLGELHLAVMGIAVTLIAVGYCLHSLSITTIYTQVQN